MNEKRRERSLGNNDEDCVFLDFPFNAQSRNLDALVHAKKTITYGKYGQTLSIWMASHVGVHNATEFLSIYGTRSGRSGGAIVACDAHVPTRLWQKHGGCSLDVKWRDVPHNKQYRHAVGRAVILHRFD